MGLTSNSYNEIYNLWNEYESGNTKESQLCKDIDKYEMILQAFEYEKAGFHGLDDFFITTKGIILLKKINLDTMKSRV